jgi:hypothetical protein
MNTLLEKVGDLNDMLLQGQQIEALEKFYDAEVEVQENDRDPVRGKDKVIEARKAFLATIKEISCVRPLKVAVGEGTTMVEWQVTYQLNEGKEQKFTQVAIQEWKDGQIVKEKFYFGN